MAYKSTKTHKCKRCSKRMSIKNHNFPYCTIYCANKKELLLYKNICHNCKKEFTNKNPHKLYCSSGCKSDIYSFLVKSRFYIFNRDKFKCYYCGKSSDDGCELHLDHVYPVSKGGQNDYFNLITSCKQCNFQKTNQLLLDEDILNIWERNRKISIAMGESSYENLKEIFNNVANKRKK